ncbi:metal-dependent amidase/aminoacylase/carboxypeptidase family protein [Microbacterium amylolyticum]|uniref:Metal-dependent amidase/aminoacylase/carboxypeptidase family protein n=1 Tax=Microbacterium amylolyticum TaxID=936337 RepID=A0ABS4ZIP2_9MICO|nr:metal-dependent amidase/aminoacylase/carboxypeptidase family protein [Microbacterium amylolyticum]
MTKGRPMIIPDFTADARSLLPELIALRRALHAGPEIGLVLPRTQRRVPAALEGLPLEITTGTRTTSVVAVLRGTLPGPVVLLRGDMDGLPLVEETDLDERQYARVRPRSAHGRPRWRGEAAQRTTRRPSRIGDLHVPAG